VKKFGLICDVRGALSFAGDFKPEIERRGGKGRRQEKEG